MAGYILLYMMIAAGGALGALARLCLSDLVTRRWGGPFPMGTLVVNVTGAAAIGVLAGGSLPPDGGSPLWAAGAVGLLGSFTTVSSFSLQTLGLIRGGQYTAAAGNAAGTVLLCLAAVAAGFWIAGSGCE